MQATITTLLASGAVAAALLFSAPADCEAQWRPGVGPRPPLPEYYRTPTDPPYFRTPTDPRWNAAPPHPRFYRMPPPRRFRFGLPPGVRYRRYAYPSYGYPFLQPRAHRGLGRFGIRW